eukprot:TRINITY_DN8471_c0_g1_i1.p1 TRINITY_DN8471_c0_g1~~TRINITY_DN8471_c0_g1_i1.p1  ORF type:complete len:424 (-),score=141.27 TRINITY_DN8471_c0_g1_i1:119-1336(-)
MNWARFAAICLPCCATLVLLATLATAMALGSTEWVLAPGYMNETFVSLDQRQGLFRACSDGDCGGINWDVLGPEDKPDCYGKLAGGYRATAAFAILGMVGGVATLWLLYRYWRALCRSTPTASARRWAWGMAAVAGLCLIVAFGIFLGTNRSSGDCEARFCERPQCGWGAALWFTLAAALLLLLVAAWLWRCQLVPSQPVTSPELALHETTEVERRELVVREEEAAWRGVYQAAWTDRERLRAGYVVAQWQHQEAQHRAAVEAEERQAREEAEAHAAATRQWMRSLHARDEPQLRPSLGVEIKMLDDAYGNKDVLVTAHSVFPDGPAMQAGVREEDVLACWNGRPLQSKQEFAECLRASAVGSTVTLTIWRGGQELMLPVRIGGTAKKKAAPRTVASLNAVGHQP